MIAVECSLNCLAAAGYPKSWTDAEQEVIERFFTDLLRAYCIDPEAFQPSTIGGDLGGYLCMIGCAGGDIRSALAVLESMPEQQLARALA